MSIIYRVSQPPSTGDPALDYWLQIVAAKVNSLPAISIVSTVSGPESVVTAMPGTLAIDVGSGGSDRPLWIKGRGSGNTGWLSILMG